MTLLIIFGPPAVGKATVGREVANLTGFKLFHNHVSLDAVNTVFEWGTPEFALLVSDFRMRMIEEAARAGIDVIFTFVWAFDRESERDEIDAYKAIVEGYGGRTLFCRAVRGPCDPDGAQRHRRPCPHEKPRSRIPHA